VVSLQEAARISIVLANDADSPGAVESYPMAEGESHVRKFDILDWYFHGAKSSVQSLLDHLVGSFV
jgi:hypothetical protein